MAVVYTGGRTQDAQDFTSSKRLLLAAVDKFMGRKLDSVTISRNNEYFRVRDIDPGRIDDPDEQERVYNARNMLNAMKQVAEWFGGVRGRRKSMLLISEGLDYDLSDVIRDPSAPASSATSLLHDIQETINATARSNVSIYSIDPRGLSGLADESIEVAQFAGMEDRTTGISQASLQNDLRVSQDSLRTLANETGGFAAVNRNDFTSAFQRIVADNSSYYVLAYYPPSDKRDGKFHKIEIKVNRPGLTVRSRRGYTAPRGKPSPQNTKTGGLSPEVFEAINSPIQISGLTLRAFATPFKGTAPNSSVLVGVEMLGRDLTLEGNNKVDVSFLAVDAKSKVYGPRTSSMTLNLRPDTRARVAESGVRVLNRMELPPGRYQLRMAARDSTRGNVGTIVYDLDVPDFYKDPIAMSGIAITSLGSAGLLTAQIDEQLKTVLPAPPVSARSFAQNDELALFTEVYDNSGAAPHKVDVVASVLTDEGRVLFKTEESFDSSELQGGKGGYGYTARIPLSEIAPGPYVLKVEARSRLGRDVAVDRQVQFQISAASR
jgi:VWFA-related protein